MAARLFILTDGVSITASTLFRSDDGTAAFLESYGSPMAILLSSVIAFCIAFYTVRQNRAISRRLATFEYLSRLKWDKDFIICRETYLRYKAGYTKLRAIAEKYHKYQENPPKDKEKHKAAITDIIL